MDDTRLPLVKEIRDFFESIKSDGHDLFSALEIVLDEEYDKALIDSYCDLRIENIKLEEAIRLCHERFEAEKDFVRIGRAVEKVFEEWPHLGSSCYVDEDMIAINRIVFNNTQELLEWAEKEG